MKVFTTLIHFKQINITLSLHSLQSAWFAFQNDRGNLLGFSAPKVTKAPILWPKFLEFLQGEFANNVRRYFFSFKSIYQIIHIQFPQHRRQSGLVSSSHFVMVCESCSLTVDIAIVVPEPLADHVTNRNGGLWGPVSQISCEHVLWSSLDDQIYWLNEYHVAKAPNTTLNEPNR